MNNFNPLIVGMTGSGKTVYTREHLIPYAPRVLILDRQGEYENGSIFYGWRESVDFWRAHIADDWHITFRGENHREHLAWIDLLVSAQTDKSLNLPPVALVMEESSYYSDTHNIGPALDKLYTKGRHGRISVITIVQHLPQVHPIVRNMSHVWICFRLRSLPSVLNQRFTADEMSRFPTLDVLRPNETPVYGKHYFTDTGEADPIPQWIAAVR